MSEYQNVTWWSLSGWTQKPASPAWLQFMEAATADDENFDWWKDLERCGYEFVDREADYEGYPLQLNVARHDDGHVMVEMTDVNSRLFLFFVEAEDAVAFFATKYLELRKDIVVIQTGEFQRDMRRYQIAFIRHGHGEKTVDADGWFTLDERRAMQKRQEEMRAARERAEKPTIQ